MTRYQNTRRMTTEFETRSSWVSMLDRIAYPVLSHASRETLVQALPAHGNRPRDIAAAEALCRTLAGITPFLTSETSDSEEIATKARLYDAARQGLASMADSTGPMRSAFDRPGQALVEAAFLAHALLRTPKFWDSLETPVQRQVIDLLRSTRTTTPPFMNWLLFSGMVEAFLSSIDEPYDAMRIDYAVRQHEQWYLGDGAYGDGPKYHHDYYNSYVIQPMLVDVLEAMERVSDRWSEFLPKVQSRFARHLAVQERMIAPDGSFPVVGRSISYRCGAFQSLAQGALQQRLLQAGLRPAQVRCGLGAVIDRCLNRDRTFDEDGWLTIGLAGYQPSLAESYISRGSVYLCTTAFLPLGLNSVDPFWTTAPEPWTGRLAWLGSDVPADQARD